MLFIALTTAAAAVIWLTLLVRLVGVYGGCLVLVVVASCFGYDFYHVKVGPLPLSADRVMVGLLVGLFVVQRAMRIIPAKPLDKSDLLFGAYLAALTINTLLHEWWWRDSLPLAHLMFLYCCPAPVYWLMRQSAVNEQRIGILFGVLALFGVYLGLTAVAEVSQVYAVVFPRYIVDAPFTEWMGRARGPFLNPTTNGMYLSASLFAWAMFWPRARGLGRIAVLAGMAIVLLGISCTLTRSCWLGAAVGLVLIGLAAVPRTIKIPAVLLGGLVALLLLTVGGDNWQSFKRDKNVSQFHMEQSAKLRPILAAVAWRIFLDYPVFGCGYGQYKRVDVDYLRDPTSELPLEEARKYVQHNLFLAILVETGLLGLALYLATLSCWVWRGWQLWQNQHAPLRERQVGLLLLAVMAQWVLNGMFHDVALATNANLLLFLIAGTALGVPVPPSRFVRPAADRRRPIRETEPALA